MDKDWFDAQNQPQTHHYLKNLAFAMTKCALEQF